jgi:hypothetical protein
LVTVWVLGRRTNCSGFNYKTAPAGTMLEQGRRDWDLLFTLVFISALCVFGWLDVSVAWRHQAHRRRGSRERRGVLVSNRRATLPATVGLTLFLAAGWVLFISGNGSGISAGRAQYTAGGLIFIGLVFTACFIVVFMTGRPRLMVPPSRQSEGERSVRDSGDSVAMAHHDLTLRAGEYEVGRFFANHVQGDHAYGGRLFITNERLVFVPVAGSQSRGASRSELELKEVSVAEVASRGSGPSVGALRRRLKVGTFSECAEYFIVWRPKKLASSINGILQGSR